MNRYHGQRLDDAVRDVTRLYRAMEDELFAKIAYSLRKHGDKYAISEWHARALREFGAINRETIAKLSEASGVGAEIIRDSLIEFATDSFNDVDKTLLRHLPAPTSSVNIREVVRGMQRQVFADIDNFINQTLITTNLGRGNLQRTFTKIVENTVMNVIAGNMTHKQGLERALLEQAQRGIPSSFVDKRGNRWSMERYLNMVLRSTYNRTYNEIRMERMADFDVHTVLVSALDDPAPRCSEVQGTVVDMRENPPTNEFRSIYDFGYGDANGVLGVNCRHQVWPFIPGVNTNNQDPIDPELGEERYKARQRMKEIERRIDNTKRQLAVADLEKARLTRQLARQKGELAEHIKKYPFLDPRKVAELQNNGYNRNITKLTPDVVYRSDLDGRFGNSEVRKWYVENDKDIINRIDKSQSLEMQARQAHSLRNTYRQQARNMMSDRDEVVKLDKNKPHLTFRQLMKNYLPVNSGDLNKTYRMIVDKSMETNVEVNKNLGLE